ncbi:MAG: hypothetical protein U0992_09615 [Planctomycetaceae bacterium]
MVRITAGLRRKPDESRLDLINRNATLFPRHSRRSQEARLLQERDRVRRLEPGRRPDCTAMKELDLPPQQVIGLGTVLDTTRLCAACVSASAWMCLPARLRSRSTASTATACPDQHVGPDRRPAAR